MLQLFKYVISYPHMYPYMCFAFANTQWWAKTFNEEYKKSIREPQQKYTIQPKSEYMNQKQNGNCSCYKREDD